MRAFALSPAGHAGSSGFSMRRPSNSPPRRLNRLAQQLLDAVRVHSGSGGDHARERKHIPLESGMRRRRANFQLVYVLSGRAELAGDFGLGYPVVDPTLTEPPTDGIRVLHQQDPLFSFFLWGPAAITTLPWLSTLRGEIYCQ